MLNKHIIMNGGLFEGTLKQTYYNELKYTWLFGETMLNKHIIMKLGNYVKQTYYNERWNTLDYLEKVS